MGVVLSAHLTLTALIGTPEAWQQFEPLWTGILGRWGCSYLHMREAHHLWGPFSKAVGWTDDEVGKLICDLANNCFNHVRYHHEDRFYAATCTVNLDDYERACHALPGLRGIKTAEALCVDHAVTWALRALPANNTDPTGKSGYLELCFDRGEPFRHQLGRVWERQKKKPGIFRLMSQITTADSKTTPPLQAADLIAWHTTRGLYRRDGLELFAAMMLPSARLSLDYDGIMARCEPVYARQES